MVHGSGERARLSLKATGGLCLEGQFGLYGVLDWPVRRVLTASSALYWNLEHKTAGALPPL